MARRQQQIPTPTTNVGDLTQWMRTNANLDPEGNSRDSAWKKTLSQMAMAQKTDWQTMLGFALGKLLRGGFDDWKERYDARGYLKSLETLPTDERDAALKNRYGDNPAMLEYLKGQTSAPESQVNTEIFRQYLPNGDWQGAATNGLTPWQQQLREAVRLQRW